MKSESDNEVQLNFIALPFVLEVYKQNFQKISLSQNNYYLPRESFFWKCVDKKYTLFLSLGAEGADFFFFEKISSNINRVSLGMDKVPKFPLKVPQRVIFD